MWPRSWWRPRVQLHALPRSYSRIRRVARSASPIVGGQRTKRRLPDVSGEVALTEELSKYMAFLNTFQSLLTCPGNERQSHGSLLQAIPEIRISKRKLRQVESIHLVREQRENRNQQLAFHARPFVLCGLPLRRPPKSQLVHVRHSGNFFLHVTAHPDFGLPFGQDRLIPIWVATLALQQNNRTIHFESAAQMLEFFRLPKDGPHYGRLVAGFERIFAATIFFGTDERLGAARLIDFSRFHFFDRMRLWFNADPTAHGANPGFRENDITLCEAFHEEIDQRRIPVEREAIARFAHAPGTLDYYIWLVWKSWTVNRT